MRQNLVPAIIIAIGLIVGGFLAGGRYAIAPSQSNAVARLDRFTGQVSMCVIGAGSDSCGWTIRPRTGSAASDLPPCESGAPTCEPWERAWPSPPPVGTMVPGKAN